jgi:hypothetical protein
MSEETRKHLKNSSAVKEAFLISFFNIMLTGNV